MSKVKPGTANYFDELGEDFDRFMTDYDVDRRLRLIFDVLLVGADLRGRRVLEVGCGTGRFSRRIREAGAELIALDIGRNLVRNTVDKTGGQGVVGDACNLAFAAGSFDFVICSECVEHTPDPLTAIREMCRVLRPGGVICLSTPNRLWYPVLWLSQKLHLRRFAGFENWVFPAQAARILRQSGMQGVRFGGCHILPFQLKPIRPLLRAVDHAGGLLYPLMINFAFHAVKDRPAQ